MSETQLLGYEIAAVVMCFFSYVYELAFVRAKRNILPREKCEAF